MFPSQQVRRDYLAWTPAEKDPKEDGTRIIPQHGIEEHQNMMNGSSLPVEVEAPAAEKAPAESDK